MNNFEFYNPTKIIFGRGAENQVGAEVKKYSSNILFVHYGDGVIEKLGLYGRIVASLKKEGVSFTELKGVKPNPVLSLVHEGIRVCRAKKLDFVLAVGGGSVIDTAKSIAVGVPYDGDVWDFYMEKGVPQKALPVGVVLTIPAAGSEVSPDSVIIKEDINYKTHLTTILQRAKFSILDPEVTLTLPRYQTACGGADIMAHVIERYMTQVKNVALTDRLCEGTLKAVIDTLPIVLKDPGNYDARAEIMWAGSVAHNSLLDTGRLGDWASHMIEHELHTYKDIAHGAGLTIVMPAWMKYVYKAGLEKFVQFAVRVWNVEQDFDHPEKTALAGIERYVEFNRSLGLPSTLNEIGITEAQFARIAERTRKSEKDTVGWFVKLTNADIVNVLKLCA
jgi:alcohol dehydrogenase YqhD (iron-dependent ADH family)